MSTRRQFLRQGGLLAASGTLAGCASTPRTIAAAVPVDGGPVPTPLPTQAAAHEGLATLPDVRLYYWDTGGNGEAVIFLHPFTGSAHVWSYQQPVFARAGYRVIGYSRRGYQGSEAGPHEHVPTGAEDLAALADALGIQRFHLVGSAGGAFVSADFAIHYPQRLRSLTLACSILGVQDGGIAELNAALRVQGFDAMPAYFRELSPSYRAANPEGTTRWRDLEASSVPGDRVMQPNSPQLTLASLKQLSVPHQLLCGDSDLIAPPPLMRRLAAQLGNAPLHVIPECGHSAYWERPDLFNRHVLDFLQLHSS